MPDWFYTEYTQALTDGLVGNMLVQPAKPYSNPQMGQFYLKRFISGKSTARIQAENGRQIRRATLDFSARLCGQAEEILMVLTSGDGLIYNVARARMLAATFRWTDTDKYRVDRRRGLRVRRGAHDRSPTW